jgi:EmrB/QacA subfamily drug resistance transporter
MSDRTVADSSDPTHADHPSQDPRRWFALFVIGLSQLMVILDATITNVALPSAIKDINLQPSDLSWIITAYSLPFGALLLLGGRIADYLGRKRVLIYSLIGFAVASVIGGAAHAPWMMFLGRGLQGVFGAALAPAALSLLTVTFTEAKDRAKAFAVFGAIAGGGAAIGLILGGVLTEYLDSDAVAGWRWCFFVNIPIAVIAAILGVRILRESKSQSRGHYDLPGALTATLGLGALVWGFTRPIQEKEGGLPGERVGWGNFETIGWIIAAVLLLALFVFIESRSTNPLLPLRIVENRNRAAAYLIGALTGAGMFAVFLFLTLYLQSLKGYTPMETGLAFLPFSGGIVVGAGIGSQLVLKFGPKWVIAAGATLGAAALFWFSTLELTTPFAPTLLFCQLLMSFGMGFVFMATTNLALVGISHDDAGVASAVVNTTQQIGGSIGTALLTTVYVTGALTFVGNNPLPADAAPEAQALLAATAQVEGFGVGYVWAACLFIAAVVIAVVLINADKKDVADTEQAVHMG